MTCDWTFYDFIKKNLDWVPISGFEGTGDKPNDSMSIKAKSKMDPLFDGGFDHILLSKSLALRGLSNSGIDSEEIADPDGPF